MITIFIGLIGLLVFAVGMYGVMLSPQLSDGAALGVAITLVGALIFGLALTDAFFQYFGMSP